jgi:hypothetical protein
MRRTAAKLAKHACFSCNLCSSTELFARNGFIAHVANSHADLYDAMTDELARQTPRLPSHTGTLPSNRSSRSRSGDDNQHPPLARSSASGVRSLRSRSRSASVDSLSNVYGTSASHLSSSRRSSISIVEGASPADDVERPPSSRSKRHATAADVPQSDHSRGLFSDELDEAQHYREPRRRASSSSSASNATVSTGRPASRSSSRIRIPSAKIKSSEIANELATLESRFDSSGSPTFSVLEWHNAIVSVFRTADEDTKIGQEVEETVSKLFDRLFKAGKATLPTCSKATTDNSPEWQAFAEAVEGLYAVMLEWAGSSAPLQRKVATWHARASLAPSARLTKEEAAGAPAFYLPVNSLAHKRSS